VRQLKKLMLFSTMFLASCATPLQRTRVPVPELRFFFLDGAGMGDDGSALVGVEALKNYGCLSPEHIQNLLFFLKESKKQ